MIQVLHPLRRVAGTVAGLRGRIARSYRDFPDDVYLVSYPKSGNTWVRFLLANLLRPEGNPIDFHSVHTWIPDLDREPERVRQLPRPRFVKSHRCLSSRYRNVIYVLRDGRDAYVSLFHHHRRNLPAGTTFEQFLAAPPPSYGTWGDHVRPWLSGEVEGIRSLVVRYETLLASPEAELRRMAEFAGLKPSAEGVSAAVARSSFQSMQQIEQEHGRRFPGEGPERFVREGRAGGWREQFTEPAREVFKAREGAALVFAGYEADESW